jgi:hypothetical protein
MGIRRHHCHRQRRAEVPWLFNRRAWPLRALSATRLRTQAASKNA